VRKFKFNLPPYISIPLLFFIVPIYFYSIIKNGGSVWIPLTKMRELHRELLIGVIYLVLPTLYLMIVLALKLSRKLKLSLVWAPLGIFFSAAWFIVIAYANRGGEFHPEILFVFLGASAIVMLVSAGLVHFVLPKNTTKTEKREQIVSGITLILVAWLIGSILIQIPDTQTKRVDKKPVAARQIDATSKTTTQKAPGKRTPTHNRVIQMHDTVEIAQKIWPYKLGKGYYNFAPGAGLNMRNKPSSENKIIGLIPHGAQLEVLSNTQNPLKESHYHGYWAQVKYNNIIAYVCDFYLTQFPLPEQKRHDAPQSYYNLLKKKGFKARYESKTDKKGTGYAIYTRRVIVGDISAHDAFLIGREMFRLPQKWVLKKSHSNKNIYQNKEKPGWLWSDEVTVFRNEEGAPIKYKYYRRHEGGGTNSGFYKTGKNEWVFEENYIVD